MGERRTGEDDEQERRKIPRFSDARVLAGIKSIKKWVLFTMCCFSVSALLLVIQGAISGVLNVGVYFFGAFFLIFFTVVFYRSFSCMRLFVDNESLGNLQKVIENQIGLFLTIAISSLVLVLACLVMLIG